MKRFAAFFIITLFAAAAVADVPPGPGQTRVRPSLILVADEPIKNFQLVFESFGSVERVPLEPGKPFTLSSEGRGGTARMGTLYALPADADESLFRPDSDGVRRAKIADLIKQGQLPTAVKLLDHQFQKDIGFGERGEDAVYRIVIKDGKPTAEAVDGNPKADRPLYATGPRSFGFWAAVIGGSLLTLAVIGFGAWYVRRAGQNSRA